LCFLDKFEQATEHPSQQYARIEFVQIRIHSSKTDKRGEGVNLRLKRSRAVFMCPVEAAYVLWPNASQIGLRQDEPLCSIRRQDQNVPLKAAKVASLLKSAATSLGKDPRNYGTHSLRSGGATAMFKGNISKTAIKLFGRCDVEDMASRMVGMRFTRQASVGNHQPNPVGLL
jgi:hypothetical protein